MKEICAVLHCPNNSKDENKSNPDGRELIFHRFPKNLALLNQWLDRCGGELKNPTSQSVCSDHFSDDDYEKGLQDELTNSPAKYYLKDNAIPSKNIPHEREFSTLKQHDYFSFGMMDSIMTPVKNEMKIEVKNAFVNTPDIVNEPFRDILEGTSYLLVEPNNISSVCRICLCLKSDLKSLYEIHNERSLVDMLTVFTAEQLLLIEDLPKNVCKECSDLILKCFSFKQLCDKSESLFRNYISQNNIPVEINTISSIHNSVNDTQDNKTDVLTYEDYSNDDFHDSLSPAQNPIKEEPVEEIYIQTKTRNIKNRAKSNVKIKDPKLIYKRKLDQQNSPENSTDSNEKKTKTDDFFLCTYCEKGFPKLYRLIRHEKIHDKEKPFSCKDCKQGFASERDYLKHVKKHKILSEKETESSTGPVFPCPDCHLKFTLEGDLQIHSSVHIADGDKCVCQHCKKEFNTKLQLKRHVRTHLSDKPHKCAVCHKGFAEMGSLTRHYRKHTGDMRERKHSCQYCSKSYFDLYSLKIHLRHHTGEKPWKCEDCGKHFIDSRLLNSHRKTHSDIKPYACNVCEKRFRHESTLTTHKRTHTGERPYICTVCGSAFVQSSNLSLHMRTHTRERPYPCRICPKRFSSSSALTSHTRIHTGEKPYTCPLCPRRFARHDLKLHLRIHTGEKPHACNICNRKFNNTSQLQQHIRIHTGEKPFVCNICGKGCTKSALLKVHMSKFHNIFENDSVSIKFESLPAQKVKEDKPATPNFITSDGQVLKISTDNLDETNITVTVNELELTNVPHEFKTEENEIVSAVETIVTNSVIADEKMYEIDPGLIRIHHVSGTNVIHSG